MTKQEIYDLDYQSDRWNPKGFWKYLYNPWTDKMSVYEDTMLHRQMVSMVLYRMIAKGRTGWEFRHWNRGDTK